jgi:CelD/BcsL family acetyltransferase involved in cellulose biosynthesis
MTTTVTILPESGDALAEWEQYVLGHPDATVYHRVAWREIFGRGLGYRSWLLAAREAGGAIRGVLPLYLVPAPFRRRLVAVPFRDRGGPLWDTPEALDALLARSGSLVRETGSVSLQMKSLHPLPAGAAERYGLMRRDYWVHSSAALAGLDADALWRRVGDKTRNMVRQAESQGLACRVVTGDDGAVARWHRLHVATQKRLGIPPFPARFFVAMLDALRGTGGIELMEVARDGVPCAGTILLLHRDTCIYGYSASTDDGQRARANDLMLHTAFKLAIARGLARFDLGSDSPVQESLLFFKRKWGAAQSVIPLYCSGKTGALPDSSDTRYALARAALRLMPAPLLAALGGRLTRYFG